MENGSSKLNYKKIFLLGLGFFSITMTWSVYNAFVPKMLSNFISSSVVIGFIMTLDNYLALFIQPTIGMYSDRMNTRFGRRVPFLMVGMPLAALFVVLIPSQKGLATFIVCIVLMNLSMSIFRSPAVALMPDVTPEEHRSKGNSIINVMGGIGSLVAYFIGGILWNVDTKYPFYLAGFLVIMSFIIIITAFNEKRDVLKYEEAEEKIDLKKGLKLAFKNKNTVYLLLAICAWLTGFSGIEAFFTRYGELHLGVDVGSAALSFTFISLSYLGFAIPAGIIGTKLGKKKTIVIGVCGLILCFFILGFIKNMIIIRIIFFIAGALWATININSYPFVAQMAPPEYVGTFTGLYYLFYSVASIVSPPLLGLLLDGVGYGIMFFYGTFFLIIALFLIIKVKVK